MRQVGAWGVLFGVPSAGLRVLCGIHPLCPLRRVVLKPGARRVAAPRHRVACWTPRQSTRRAGTSSQGPPSPAQPRARGSERVTLDDFFAGTAGLPASSTPPPRRPMLEPLRHKPLCPLLGRSTPLFPPIIININQHPTPLPLLSPSRTPHRAACLFPLHSTRTFSNQHFRSSVPSFQSVGLLAKGTHPRTSAHRTHTLGNIVFSSGTTVHHITWPTLLSEPPCTTHLHPSYTHSRATPLFFTLTEASRMGCQS